MSMEQVIVVYTMHDILISYQVLGCGWKTNFRCGQQKRLHTRSLDYINLVGPGGFEPPTSTTSMWRSSQMS